MGTRFFNQLQVPDHWDYYFTKYPQGYTMLDALMKWVGQVNDMTNNVNDWNKYLEEFVEQFDVKLQKEVADMLTQWLLDGKLAEIINEEVFVELSGGVKRLNAISDTTQINVLYPPKGFEPVIPNGKDMSKQIQAIMDLAMERPITLYFPQGTYGVGEYLFWHGNTTLKLHTGAVLKRLGSLNKVLQNGEQGNDCYACCYCGDSNLHLIGGKIDLNSEGFTGSLNDDITGINIGHGQNVIIENLEITNGQNGHYFQISSSKDVVIRNCKFTDQHQKGDSNIHEVVQIEVMSEVSFPSFGSYDQTPSKNVTIENCVFENVIRGIGQHGDAKFETDEVIYCENIKILNNTFRNVKSMCLGIVGYKNTIIEGNIAENIGMHGLYVTLSENVTIENNRMKNIQWSAIQAKDIQNCTIVNNEFYETVLATDATRSPIRLYGVIDSFFDNNKVSAKKQNYAYAHYFSDGTKGNRIQSHRYDRGALGDIYGDSSEQINDLQTGNGRKLLFDGDAHTEGTTIDFSNDIRLYSMIIVIGNNNDGNANMVSLVIPKDMYNLSTANGRFRLLTANGEGQFYIDFSTPTSRTLRIDNIGGNGHIHKVVGIV